MLNAHEVPVLQDRKSAGDDGMVSQHCEWPNATELYTLIRKNFVTCILPQFFKREREKKAGRSFQAAVS